MIPRCGSCGLYKTCNSPKMKPYGEGEKSILIVGEAPGATEDEEGRPFVGKAGEYLRNVIRQIGGRLDRDAITTNALICRPPHNATPDSKQISWCRPNLVNTIQEVEPRTILTLGRSALASVLTDHWKSDVGAMERWVGWKIPLGKHWICPTYHPSFLLRMRNPLLDKLFADHIEQAFEINENPPQAKEYEKQVEILYGGRDLYNAIRDIDHQGGWAAVDYETNCLKPEYPKARIVSCSISNGRRTVSYPWNQETAEWTSRFLKSSRTRKISSNLKMEERWTRFFLGHPVSNWGWDTMLAAHVIDNRQSICSLKFQAFVNLGVETYNENIEPYLENASGSPYNRIEEIDMSDLLLYGGMDSALEYDLAMNQREIMGYED